MKIMLSAAFALAALVPAAASAQTAPAAPTAPAAKFNLDTPVETIAADPAGKAALDGTIPGLTTHAQYEMFKGMSLNQLSGVAPDKLTPDILAKAAAELAKVQ